MFRYSYPHYILLFLHMYVGNNAQWAFLAQNGMEKAQKSTVFYTYFYNGNF